MQVLCRHFKVEQRKREKDLFSGLRGLCGGLGGAKIGGRSEICWE